MTYLKKAARTSESGQEDVREKVQAILNDIEAGGEAKTREYAARFDSWEDEVVVSAEARAAAAAKVPDRLKDDIRFAHERVRRFAEVQRDAILDAKVELSPGLIAGTATDP